MRPERYNRFFVCLFFRVFCLFVFLFVFSYSISIPIFIMYRHLQSVSLDRSQPVTDHHFSKISCSDRIGNTIALFALLLSLSASLSSCLLSVLIFISLTICYFVVDRFYIALFSALEQTHCAIVSCDSE